MDSNDKRKPIMRRRSISSRRRVPQDSSINMAQARREIVHALHLHRSSSSRTTTSTSTPTSSSSSSTSATILGNCNRNYFDSSSNKLASSLSSQSQYCYCYTLTESMPIPEPIWSTTQPSIPVEAAPVVVPVVAAMEGFEFEWGSSENQAASYSWWLGFLNSLDSKKNNNSNNNNNNIFDQNYSKYHMGGGQNICDVNHQAPRSVDASHDHDQQNSSPDEWLMFPTNDDDHQNY